MYLQNIGWVLKRKDGESANERIPRIRAESLQGLEAAAKGKLPGVSPRGIKKWTPRLLARRAAWHVVDHAWEIDDRIT